MDEHWPKVSIILPAYNGSKYLRQAIDSCLNQTYKNIELIIVDDGSTDGSSKIIRSYNDSRIIYIRHGKNKGLPHSLNTGFSKAIGEYLTWTSDDNEYLLRAIEEMVTCLRTNPDVDFVYTDYWAHNLDSGEKGLRRLPDRLALDVRNEVGPCFLYTRRVYRTIGDYNPKLTLVEDYDYWIRINNRFKCLHYPVPLYLFRQHAKSLTSTKYEAISLFDSLLKYQNGYISFKEVGASVFHFILHTVRSKITTQEKAVLLIRNTYRVFHLSFRLSIMALLSSFWILVVKVPNKLYHTVGERFILNPFFIMLEHLTWYISSKKRLYRFNMVQNRKNILFIAPYLHVGGGPKVLTDIAKAAGRGEFSFHIIGTEPEGDVWDRFRLYFDNVIVAAGRVASQRVCNKYMLELIERLKIDLVLITDSRHGYRALPLLKSKFGNIKIVDLLHSEKCWAASHDYGWVTPYIDKRVLISNYLKAFMVNRYRASGYGDEHLDRLEVIHNGVDFREYDAASGIKGKFKAKFGIDGDCKVISFVGRFSQEKNPILFLNIARNVIMRSPSEKLKFVMAGDGPELRRVRDSMIRYGLGDHVILPGMVNSIPELLADTHLLLIVSKIEGIPLAIEEALAMKVPVLSIDVGAVRELIKNEVNGFIIDQGANVVEQFTCTILDLLLKKEKYEALASRTRKSLVPEFLTETTGENYRKLFQELLA